MKINMKRYILFITALAFLVVPLALSNVSPVGAVPICPDGEPVGSDGSCDTGMRRTCYNKWNGESPLKDSDKAKEYTKSGCDTADGGSCTSKTVTKDGKKHLEISCKKPTDTSSSANLDGYTDPAVDAQCTGSKCDIIDNFVNPAIRLLSVLVGIAAAAGIIIGAIQVSTSAGDPQKAANGKNHIRNAIIALVTYVLLFVVLNWLIPGGAL